MATSTSTSLKPGRIGLLVLAVLFGMVPLVTTTAAPNFNNPGFANTWNRVDKPVEDLQGGAGRGYTWGPAIPQATAFIREPYNGGQRTIQYFDKARMEVNNPDGNQQDLFYVTTGLLVKELVTGKRQDGDNSFTQAQPSEVQVVGDTNESGGNQIAPTYASFRFIGTFNGTENGHPSMQGQVVTEQINRAGQVSIFNPPEARTITGYDPVTQHNMPDVFVAFANSTGPIWNGSGYSTGKVFFDNPVYVMGRPLTEAYWTRAYVRGNEQDVLVQLYERRVLTYTPGNPEGFKVEMGNVGQHYFRWRYQENVSNPPTSDYFPNDFSQLRAAYNRSGPIPTGGTSNLRVISTGSKTSNIFNTPVVDTEHNIAVFAAAENGIVGLNLNDDPAKISVAWHFQPETPAADVLLPYYGNPLLYKSVVYIGVGTRLYALNSNDGSLRWVKQLSDTFGLVGAPITDGKNLYLTDTSSNLFAIQLTDGTPVWQKTIAPDLPTTLVVNSGPIFGFDNNIFVATTSGKVAAYTSQGVPVSDWATVVLDGGVYASPAFANETLYIGTQAAGQPGGGKLIALNRYGQKTGEISLQGSVYNTPAVVGDRVYVAVNPYVRSGRGMVIGVSVSNINQIVYTIDTKSPVDASLAVVDNYLYFGGDDGDFYQVSASNPANSKILFKANRLFNLNSAVVANGWVYVSNADGNLYLVK